MPTNLFGRAYRIDGEIQSGDTNPVTGEVLREPGTIPAGTTLTEVLIRTEDPDDRDYGISPAFQPSGALPPVRDAEEVNIFVNGQLLATESPSSDVIWSQRLETDAGPVFGTIVVLGGDTYFIPRNTDADLRPTTVIEDATAGEGGSGIGLSNLLEIGFLPEGHTRYEGAQFFGSGADARVPVSRTVVIDDDNIPLNGGANENGPFNASVLVTVTFDDGTTLAGVQAYQFGSVSTTIFGQPIDTRGFAVEVAAIEAAGFTLDDIADADFEQDVAHDLTYEEVGFAAVAEVPAGDGLPVSPTGPETPDPQPDPQPEPEPEPQPDPTPDSPTQTGDIAEYFFQIIRDGQVNRTGVSEAVIVDEDGIRENDDIEIRTNDEFNLSIFNEGEAITTVFFNDGSLLQNVLAIRDDFNGGVLGGASQRYIFEQSALDNAGQSYADIARVQFNGFVDHDLTFAELGFRTVETPDPDPEPDNTAPVGGFDRYQDITAGTTFSVSAEDGVLANDSDPEGDALTASLVSAPSNGTLTFAADGSFTYTANAGFDGADFFTYSVSDGALSDSVNVRLEVTAPPPPEPEFNEIIGTGGRNRLNGTEGDDLIDGRAGADRITGGDGDDVIIGGADNDRLWGGSGADSFVFGADANDRDRDSDSIRDFDASEDIIVLEQGAEIANTFTRFGDFFIRLEGDGDQIRIMDADVSVLDNIVFTDDVFIA